jgi:hypothetical protein
MNERMWMQAVVAYVETVLQIYLQELDDETSVSRTALELALPQNKSKALRIKQLARRECFHTTCALARQTRSLLLSVQKPEISKLLSALARFSLKYRLCIEQIKPKSPAGRTACAQVYQIVHIYGDTR